MSLKPRHRTTVFPQTRVTRNFPKNIFELQKSFNSIDDLEKFLFLADATCRDRQAASIEKVHVDIFKESTVARTKVASSLRETLEILLDEDLVRQIKKSEKDVKEGRLVPWNKVRANV